MANGRNKFTSISTTGFGAQSKQSGGRFYRKDGKPNIRRKGVRFFDRLSWFHILLDMPHWKFWLVLFAIYIGINLGFGTIYYSIGIDQLNGIKI